MKHDGITIWQIDDGTWHWSCAGASENCEGHDYRHALTAVAEVARHLQAVGGGSYRRCEICALRANPTRWHEPAVGKVELETGAMKFACEKCVDEWRGLNPELVVEEINASQ